MEYLQSNGVHARTDQDKVQEMAKYTTPEMREKCWKARDECFKCIDESNDRRNCQAPCHDFFSGKYCLQSWIKHFTSKRRYANAWDFYRRERSKHYEHQKESTQSGDK
mmetsp:Transcript_37241/g.59660  ORF Transcript_37241/g.59660 Transcript_37241/m.59660 type:complete len:108 (+) Transcript_37241:43-366(+)